MAIFVKAVLHFLSIKFYHSLLEKMSYLPRANLVWKMHCLKCIDLLKNQSDKILCLQNDDSLISMYLSLRPLKTTCNTTELGGC